MKIAAFDLEIAKVLPEDETDWQAHRPLGVSCAAYYATDGNYTVYPRPYIDEDTGELDDLVLTDDESGAKLHNPAVRDFVERLQGYADQGYTIVTVNGVGFDFQILAEESGMWSECANLALSHHCDFMLMSVCKLGWRTGLDAFAIGADVESKLKSVTLKDGSVLHEMNGARAPELWAAGEYEAVLAYLRRDVIATLEVARVALAHGALGWFSSTGRFWEIDLPRMELSSKYRLPTVAEMLRWRRPNTSWMTDPPDPMEIAHWALEAE